VGAEVVAPGVGAAERTSTRRQRPVLIPGAHDAGRRAL